MYHTDFVVILVGLRVSFSFTQVINFCWMKTSPEPYIENSIVISLIAAQKNTKSIM